MDKFILFWIINQLDFERLFFLNKTFVYPVKIWGKTLLNRSLNKIGHYSHENKHRFSLQRNEKKKVIF